MFVGDSIAKIVEVRHTVIQNAQLVSAKLAEIVAMTHGIMIARISDYKIEKETKISVESIWWTILAL